MSGFTSIGSRLVFGVPVSSLGGKPVVSTEAFHKLPQFAQAEWRNANLGIFYGKN